MNLETIAAIIIGAFGAGFVLLLGVVVRFGAYLLRRNDERLQAHTQSNEDLATAIQGLNKTITGIDKIQALQAREQQLVAERLAAHTQEIKDLRADPCPNSDCPYKMGRRREDTAHG